MVLTYHPILGFRSIPVDKINQFKVTSDHTKNHVKIMANLNLFWIQLRDNWTTCGFSTDVVLMVCLGLQWPLGLTNVDHRQLKNTIDQPIKTCRWALELTYLCLSFFGFWAPTEVNRWVRDHPSNDNAQAFPWISIPSWTMDENPVIPNLNPFQSNFERPPSGLVKAFQLLQQQSYELLQDQSEHCGFN